MTKPLENPNIEELVLKNLAESSDRSRWFARWLLHENEYSVEFELIESPYTDQDGKVMYWHTSEDGIDEYVPDAMKATPVLIGSVRWDHCTNFAFKDNFDGVYAHACSRKEFSAIGAALTAVHELAERVIGDKWLR